MVGAGDDLPSGLDHPLFQMHYYGSPTGERRQCQGGVPGQTHAERARERVRPARVRLRDIQRAVLGVACLEFRGLRERRQLTLGRRTAILLLEPCRAGPRRRRGRASAAGRSGPLDPSSAPSCTAWIFSMGAEFGQEAATVGVV